MLGYKIYSFVEFMASLVCFCRSGPGTSLAFIEMVRNILPEVVKKNETVLSARFQPVPKKE